jgi:tetratricopeptide (TPR) repeat protein
VLVAMLSVSTNALAQEAPPADDKEDATSKAREHMEKGQTHYNLGEFDKAIEEYKKAYDLTKAPGFLFNIAQAQRLKKDYEAALFSYRTYLRQLPEAENRADAEAWIVELEKLIAEGGTSGTKTDPKPDGPEDRVATADSGDSSGADEGVAGTGADLTTTTGATDTGARGGRNLRIVGLATAGAGVAFLATGVIFGLRASSADSELSDMAANGEVWDQAARDKYDAGQRDEKISIATLAIGGGAVITGAILYMVGRNKAKSADRTAWIAPTPGGATLAVSWGF